MRWRIKRDKYEVCLCVYIRKLNGYSFPCILLCLLVCFCAFLLRIIVCSHYVLMFASESLLVVGAASLLLGIVLFVCVSLQILLCITACHCAF